MKTIISIFSLLVIMNYLQAQSMENPGTPEERAEKMTQKMEEDLPLRPEQVSVIQELNLKYARIIQTEVLNKNLSKWSRYNKSIKINKQKEKELKPLLSDSQWKNYEKLKSEAINKAWSQIF